MKKTKIIVVIGLVSLSGFFWARPAPQQDNSLTFNRVWIDHLPQNPREKASVFLALEEEEFGIFQEASTFQGNYDLFGFRQKGDQLDLVLLQDEKRALVGISASRCNQKGFDYCLELSGAPRGPKRYLSKKGWEVDSQAEAMTLVQKLSPRE
jgi:hypothetical protein